MDQLEELSQIFRVLGFLGVLGCLAYFLTKFFNKRDRLKSPISGREGIVLCDTRALGNKQFLVVAQYDKEKFLLGVSSGSVELLAKLNASTGQVNPSSEKSTS